ncbi:MAG: HEAT repeat domain-containing protein [Candidatus Obscuribacterales bacterium]|nr:HEAT repeat domain-containing protein [Candidatus Obscuribacterales bacterium]
MKGNLVESACTCGHFPWWRHEFLAPRKPFAPAGVAKRYAPDLPIAVSHIKLILTISPEDKKLTGICHTKMKVVADELTHVHFDSREMKIKRVTLAGSALELSFEMESNGFSVKLPKTLKRGDEVEIAVEYSVVNPRAGIYFTGPSGLYPGKPMQIWTQGEDEDSQYWYPVAGADFPNHKMTSEVFATVPEQYIALSNGRMILENADTVNKTKTYHWLQDQPHVCYLIALIVGDFVKFSDSFDGLPVECYADPGVKNEAKAYFQGTADLVALFSRLYRVKYPWKSKFAQVLVQEFIFGGMENTTIVINTDRILAGSTVIGEYRRSQERLNAHELCHHWWGDLVTCRDWSHAWINEGGATYGEVEAMEFLYGKKQRDYYVKGLADIYFGEDRRYRRPIVYNRYREPIDLFDRHLYQKGGLVRHMIRYILGDEGYYRSWETFLTDHAFQTADTHDMINSIEKATGRNLREFFDQWVFAAGYPEYKVTYSFDDRSKVATVRVQQVQKLEENTGLFTMPVRFSFACADGKTRDFTVTVKESDQSFSFNTESKPQSFAFDPEGWILKKLDLSGVPRGMLIHQLHNDPEVAARVNAAEALGKLGGIEAVEALTAEMKQSIHWGVQAEAAAALGEIGSPAARQALIAGADNPTPEVRRAVVSALGKFQDDEAATFLSSVIESGQEASNFVVADAAAALGKTKSKKALAVLRKALDLPSWSEVIRIGALNGLAELNDEQSLELVSLETAAGKSMHSRPAAISALGKLAGKLPKAVEVLHELAVSPEADQFSLQMAVVGALGQAKKAESASVLSRISRTSADGRVKRAAAETLIDLESTGKGDSTAQVDELKSQLAKLSEQVRGLSEGQERLTLAHH